MVSSKDLVYLTEEIGLYVYLVIGAVGILTNILNIRVCLSKNMRNTAMGFYNFITAIFNILFFIVTLFSSSLSNFFDWTCIVGPYAMRVISQMSSWLNVMVSFDRLFLSYTYQPTQKQNRDKHLNRKRLSFIILAIFVALICVNVPGLFFHLERQSINEVIHK